MVQDFFDFILYCVFKCCRCANQEVSKSLHIQEVFVNCSKTLNSSLGFQFFFSANYQNFKSFIFAENLQNNFRVVFFCPNQECCRVVCIVAYQNTTVSNRKPYIFTKPSQLSQFNTRTKKISHPTRHQHHPIATAADMIFLSK